MLKPTDIIDAEEAVERAVRKERVMLAAQRAGGVRVLLATYDMGRATSLGPSFKAGYHGHDGARTMADGGRVDTSPGYGSGAARVSPFAVAVLRALQTLPTDRRALVVQCGVLGSRPDWGRDLPAEVEAVRPVGLDGTPYRSPVYDEAVRYAAGPDRHEEVAYTKGGPDAIARARARYADWWDGLSDLAFAMRGSACGVTVLGPVALREPWVEGLRFPGRGNRILDGERRAEFAELAGKGMGPVDLAKRFAPLTVQQCRDLKKKMAARGEIEPVDSGAKT